MRTEPVAGNNTAIGVVVAAGVVAAFHIGKLPPALPLIRAEFGLSLVAAGWLVALTQLAAATLALIGGALADRIGYRRTMAVGLVLLTGGDLLGIVAPDVATLFGARMVESCGLLMTVLPAPAILARLAAPSRLRPVMGVWGAHMPLGMAMVLLASAAWLSLTGWRALWAACAVLAAVLAATVSAVVRVRPAGPDPGVPAGSKLGVPASASLVRTVVASPGPWLLAFCFACYSSQWIGVFSFLPTLYRDEGVTLATASTLTAVGVAANVVGNLAAGWLLQHGAPRAALLAVAAATMLGCAWLAFGSAAPLAVRVAAIVMFSLVGGLIPGTLFASVAAFAPHAGAVSTTSGLMLQASSLGQLASPPLLAAVASLTGSWSYGWMATGSFACGGLLAAWLIGRRDRRVV